MRALPIALGLLACAGCEKDTLQTPEDEPVPVPEAARPQLPEPAPAQKWPGACVESYDFRTPTHTGADGIADSVIRRKFDGDGHKVYEEWERPDAPYRTAVFSYDERGLLVREEVRVERPERKVVSIRTYEYDEEGRQTVDAIDEDADGTPDWQDETDYDADGHKVWLREQREVATGRVRMNRWYFYEGDELVREEVDNDGDKKANLDISYSYDADGVLYQKRRVWRVGDYTPEITLLEYDDAGRLASEITDPVKWTYEYDDAGNLLAKERWIPAADHLGTRITYDYDCWL